MVFKIGDWLGALVFKFDWLGAQVFEFGDWLGGERELTPQVGTDQLDLGSDVRPGFQHQPLEGSAPGFGSRTKLAQVYPYRFCSKLIRCLAPLGSHRGMFHA